MSDMSLISTLPQNPKDFIHVMAGFALLPMHQLGFDTTMKFYASPSNVSHTFDLDAGGLRVYLDTASTEKKWVITCNDGRQYLTVRVLCMNSHCLVWVVVPFGSGEITSNDVSLNVLAVFLTHTVHLAPGSQAVLAARPSEYHEREETTGGNVRRQR